MVEVASGDMVGLAGSSGQGLLPAATVPVTKESSAMEETARIIKLGNGAPLLLEGKKARILHRSQSGGDDEVFVIQGLVISPSKGEAKPVAAIFDAQHLVFFLS